MGIEEVVEKTVTMSFEDFGYLSKTQRFWDEQAEWSRATFGSDTERGPLGPLKHLEKETEEARQSWIKQDIPEAKVEIADCLFLTFDAARRAGMSLDDLLDTAFRKLEINKQREWQKPTNDGPVEHVRE